MKWGTVGGRGKGNGEQKEGEVSIQPTRDLSGQESHHDAKEGFQVSEKEAQERGQGFPSKGGYQKDWVLHSDIMLIHANLVHIVLIVYMSC